MVDVVMLEFGLGGSIVSLAMLLWVRHRKHKLRRSVLRFEKIKKELGD